MNFAIIDVRMKIECADVFGLCEIQLKILLISCFGALYSKTKQNVYFIKIYYFIKLQVNFAAKMFCT